MAMKSAYELAMERLGKSSGPKLTDKQKTRLAELDRVYAAKIAQIELDLKPKIASALVSEKPEDAEKLEETLRAEVQKLMGQAKDGGGFVLMPTAAPINLPLSPKTPAPEPAVRPRGASPSGTRRRRCARTWTARTCTRREPATAARPRAWPRLPIWCHPT